MYNFICYGYYEFNAIYKNTRLPAMRYNISDNT